MRRTRQTIQKAIVGIRSTDPWTFPRRTRQTIQKAIVGEPLDIVRLDCRKYLSKRGRSESLTRFSTGRERNLAALTAVMAVGYIKLLVSWK